MCVDFKANTFILGRINRENSYRTFSVDLGGGELPIVCGRKKRENAPRNVL